MTLTATKILLSAWEKGQQKGLAQKDSIFNEAIEKKWVEQWLFFEFHPVCLCHDGGGLRVFCQWPLVFSKEHSRDDGLARIETPKTTGDKEIGISASAGSSNQFDEFIKFL